MNPTIDEIIRSYNNFGDINEFFEKIVKPSGYPFFEWNGVIYKVHKRPYTKIEFTLQEVIDQTYQQEVV